MDIKSKESYTPEEIDQLLDSVPPPDRLILLATTLKNKLSEEEISLRYKEIKAKISEDSERENRNIQPLLNDERKKTIKRYVASHIEKILNDPSIARDGHMSFVIGCPGAGKSSVIKTIRNKDGAAVVDADNIKQDFSDMFGVDVNHPDMHQVSVTVANEIRTELLKHKVNLIIEKIGDEPNQIYNMANDYKDMGYTNRLYVIHVDKDVCRQRNIDRCVELQAKGKKPRLVSDDFIKKVSNNPLMTYILLTKEFPDLFEEGKAYTNQVNFGDYPLELECLSKGKNINVEEYISESKELYELLLSQIKLAHLNLLKQAGDKFAEDMISEIFEELQKGEIRNQKNIEDNGSSIKKQMLELYAKTIEEVFDPAKLTPKNLTSSLRSGVVQNLTSNIKEFVQSELRLEKIAPQIAPYIKQLKTKREQSNNENSFDNNKIPRQSLKEHSNKLLEVPMQNEK